MLNIYIAGNKKALMMSSGLLNMAVGQGFEPWDLAIAGFQDRYFRPLSHPTEEARIIQIEFYLTTEILKNYEKIFPSCCFSEQLLKLTQIKAKKPGYTGLLARAWSAF